MVQVRLPVERVCPALYKWLHVMHMEHLFTFSSRTRAMLMLSCVISLSFSISWIMEILQLSCFMTSPWNKEGLGRYTCLYKLIGGVVLLFMFQHSMVALAYYDEDGEDLRQTKERFLSDLQQQTEDVLLRATRQASNLLGLMSADLKNRVHDHVIRMRAILMALERDNTSNAHEIYLELLTQMAKNLHRLRQPAIEHFQKLLSLSKTSGYLTDALDRMHQQSMVKVLAGGRRPVRSDTLDAPPFAGAFTLTLNSIGGSGGGLFGIGNYLLCDFPHWDNGEQPELERTSSVDCRLRLPTKDDMKEDIQELPPQEIIDHPEKAVLQPLFLVLKWFEKCQQSAASKAVGSADADEPRVRPVARIGAARNSDKSLTARIRRVWKHVKKSRMYKWFLVGIICALFFVYMYAHMCIVVIDVMWEGRCPGQAIFACLGALIHQLIGVLAMCCYTTSLGVVLWNVDRLDAVLQVQQEITDLEDFKRQIDQLNAHVLAGSDSHISIISSVMNQLAGQEQIANVFATSALERPHQLADYRKLAFELEQVMVPKEEPSAGTPSSRPTGGKGEVAENDEEQQRLVGPYDDER